MRIIELTIQEFDMFAVSHPLRNYCQNSKYAKLMGEKGYNYDYVGYYDDSNTLIAASLVLKKRIGNKKYAYAPKGFLVDYYNNELVKIFLNDICNFYRKKDYVFIKINPEIIIGYLNQDKNFAPDYNQNVKIIDDLKDLGFKRRREIVPLDMVMPRLNPYINLKTFDITKLDDGVQEKIRLSRKKGLSLETVTNREVNILYDFVKDNTNENINYYRNLINSYGDDAEIFLIKIDYETCLINARERYDKELDHNNECNERIQTDNNEDNLNEKMQSDRDLLTYKNEIVEATEGLKKEKYKYIGGVIVVKYLNRISLIVDGYNRMYEKTNPYHFMIYSLIDKYRSDYDYLDMYGLASNFSTNSKYSKFNQDKLDFKPVIYEFIGEFDYILNEMSFKKIQIQGLLSKEFNNSHKF